MNSEHIVYSVLLIVSGFLSLTISYMFYKKRKSPGALPLAVIMLFASFWSLFNVTTLLTNNFSVKLIISNIAYFPITIIPILWLLIPICYYNMSKYLKFKLLLPLAIIPMITMFFIFTDDYFHMIYIAHPIFIKDGTMYIMKYTFSTWFWVHALYSYGLIMIGTVIMLYKNMQLSKLYQLQNNFIVLSVLSPVIINILSVTKILNIKVDPTPISFIVSGILFFISMNNLKFLDLIPIAREAVLENLSDMLIVIDMQNRIVDINQSTLSFLNVKKDQVFGKDFKIIFQKWDEHISKYLDYNSYSSEFSITNDENKEQFLRIRIAPIFDKVQNITGKYIFIQDVTELEYTTRQLRVSQKEAQDANMAKSRFLATMSHEIRTPLNGIIGMSELLATTDLNSEQKKYLKSIEYSANSLLGIITEILDFSKIEAGKLTLDINNFNLHQMIQDMMESFRYFVPETIDFLYDIDKAVPIHLKGDSTRLKQVLVNLLYNAIKFTEKGEIKLKITCKSCTSTSINLFFSISDTGIGIEENYKNKLFESFSQSDNSNTRKHGGTGLGLAICKSITEAMGGEIFCQSELNIGTTFTFNALFGTPEIVENEQKPNKSTSIVLPQYKILIVEDNKTNRLFLQKLLEKKNFHISVAENGVRAIEAFNTERFDIILMDIQMPLMDGLEATRQIRALEKNQNIHTYIIALTANAFKDDLDHCIEAGMDDFLAKPIKWEKLYNSFEKYSSSKYM